MKLRKKFIVAGGILSTVLISTAAYAYFSTTGTGSGTATAGSASSLTITAPTVTGLYPGGGSKPFAIKIHSDTAGQRVHSVTATVTGTPACPASNFTVSGSPAVLDETLPAGDSTFADTALSISLDDTGVPQNGCQGVSVTLAFTSD